MFFCIFTASSTFATLQPNATYTPVQLFVPSLPILSEMPRITDTVSLPTTESVLEKPTPGSPEYLPSPQPGASQPPSPTTPLYDDPLWSPTPSPESNDDLREEIAQLLTNLPQSAGRSGMDTPPFNPATPLSYESLDVSRDISDWDDLSDVVDEVLDTSDNY
jgi:hypothetical protein